MERLVDKSITARMFTNDSTAPLPERAKTIVIGGGVIGTSIAYHLAAQGETDVLLLEANVLGSGTTWHAAGLVNSARSTTTLTEISKYSRDFYTRLGEMSGLDLNWFEHGSISMARTEGRLDEIQYQLDVALQGGVHAEMIDNDRLKEIWPLVNTEGVLGSLLIPGDGTVNPGYAAVAFAKIAHENGVQIREGVRVESLITEGDVVTGVRTNQGEIAAENVVIAAGLWSRKIARTANVALPLYPAEHVHVRTSAVPGAVPTLPILRDLDASYYIRHEEGCLLVGAFEPDGKPRPVDTITTDGFAEFEADWDHFDSIREQAESTVPALADAEYDRFLNAPESFTPDANFLLGETNEIRNLFVAAGMNSQGIIYGPGIGRELAAWIIAGTPQFDASSVDVRRFSRMQDNRRYLHDRTREGLGRLYAMHWPNLQMTTARNVRRTPLHHKVESLGAVFGEINAGERAMWYDIDRNEVEYSYNRASWFDFVAEEHRAAREGVALFDLSPFAKFTIRGAEALEVAQAAFTAEMDIELDRAVYTLQLNQSGGIELDLTVTRTAENEYLVVTPSATREKTFSILRRIAQPFNAEVFDSTNALATISVNGPLSRDLLAKVSPNDFSDEAQPFLHGRTIEIADGYAYALRVSFTGELGYELYVPSDLAENVLDALWEAGQEFDVKMAGYFALDSLRCEKGFRHLGHDMGPTDDPRSSGLWFTVSKDKEADFIGKEAIFASDTRKHRTIYIGISDAEPVFVHDETVFKNGVAVGRVTSGNYGYTLGHAIGIAIVDPEITLDGDWEVECGGKRFPAQVSAKAFYDATGSRMRG